MIKKIKKWLSDNFPARHSELTAIRAFRLIFLSICYIGVGIFLGFDVYTLCQDQRTLIYQDNYNAIIPLPIVYFDANFNFTVNCAVIYLHNNLTTNCNNYVDQTSRVFSDYYTKLNASDLNFADDDKAVDKSKAISYISLTVNINDANFTGGDAGLQVWFVDKETQFDLQSLLSSNLIFNGFNDYLATAEITNNYYLANDQSYAYFFERKISNHLTQTAVNVLTGDGKHTRAASIDGFLVSYPGDGNYAYIKMSPNSYVVRTSTEVSDMSVLDVISDLGGVVTAAVLIYRFLFGGEEIKPWGLIQNLPLVRSRVRTAIRKSLRPDIPFTGPALSKNLSTDEKVAAMERRQLALELFLKEYVVNVDNIDYDKDPYADKQII